MENHSEKNKNGPPKERLCWRKTTPTPNRKIIANPPPLAKAWMYSTWKKIPIVLWLILISPLDLDSLHGESPTKIIAFFFLSRNKVPGHYCQALQGTWWWWEWKPYMPITSHFRLPHGKLSDSIHHDEAYKTIIIWWNLLYNKWLFPQ